MDDISEETSLLSDICSYFLAPWILGSLAPWILGSLSLFLVLLLELLSHAFLYDIHAGTRVSVIRVV